MTQQKRSIRLAWVAVAAVGLAMPPLAHAQYRVGSDGHSLDANNRIGSGGFNSSALLPGSTQLSPGFTPNQNIFGSTYGNTSGIGSFAGASPDADPTGFRGRLPGSPSDVLRQISGTSSPGSAPTYNIPQPYYNPSSQVAPPAGFQAVPYSGGSFVQTPQPTRQPQDYRLGNVFDTPTPGAVPIGQAMGPGAVDPSAQTTPSFLNNSPIYGLRDVSPGVDGSSYSYAYADQNGLAFSNAYSSHLSQQDVTRLRGELGQPAPWQPNSGASQSNTPGIGAQPFTPTNLATDAAVSITPISGAADASTNGQSIGQSTGQSTRQYLPPLPAPAQQSAQYAQLRAQLDKYESAKPKNDEDANRIFQEQLRLRRKYQQMQQQDDVNAPPAPLPAPSPASLAPNAAAPAPIDVGSIGQGIRAAGLSQLVQEGEDLAHHQKFKDAITKFIEARQVAPNNMLIAVDLANAELGAGFYREAEEYLRDAFTLDPALLMGRYDIKGLMGVDRLKAVSDELRRIATQSDSTTAVFLLSYLYYNTGQPELAIGYLKLAQTRSGGTDGVINSLAEHWSLPAQSAATQPAR